MARVSLAKLRSKNLYKALFEAMPPKFRRLLLGVSLLWLMAACTPLTDFLSLAEEFVPRASTPQPSPIDWISVSGKYGGLLENVDGRISTTIGKHYTSRTEKKPVAVGHFLVLWPKIDYDKYDISTRFSTEHLGPFATESIVITLKTLKPGIPNCANIECEQRELAFRARFHVDEHTFTIGNQTFARANGNLFIVRFDENFNMQATQVPELYEKITKTKNVLAAYKAALPDDEFIQSLKIKVRMVNGKPDEPGPA